MFSFKWNYDYGKMKAIYNGVWHQLNQCSAAIAHTIDEDNNIKVSTWYFNSYVTPIMMIKVIKHKSYNMKATITVCVNEEYFGCSRTTISQTNKFLDYVGAFMIFGYRYSDIKFALNKLISNGKSFEYITDDNSPMIFACKDSNMRKVFKNRAGDWSYYSI